MEESWKIHEAEQGSYVKFQPLEWWQQENFKVVVKLDHSKSHLKTKQTYKKNPMGYRLSMWESQGILLVYMFKDHVKR